MSNLEQLNRETRECNNGIAQNISTTSGITRYGTVEYWRNYWNNETHKLNTIDKGEQTE